MAHKTITISVEAYEALASLRTSNESFTQLILGLVRARRRPDLLEYIDSLGDVSDLADAVEAVVKERDKAKFRDVVL